jgi:hypothetical protein
MDARHSHPSTIKSHSHQDAFFSGSIEKGLGALVVGEMGDFWSDAADKVAALAKAELAKALAPKSSPTPSPTPSQTPSAPANPDNTMKYVKYGGMAVGGLALVGLLLFGIRKLTKGKAVHA